MELGSAQGEHRFRRKDGSEVWASVSAVKIDDNLFLAFCQDVTERKQIEEAVAEQERYLRTILQTTVDGFWVVDGEDRLIEVNEAYCAMTGYTRAELLTKSIADVDAVEKPADIQSIHQMR